MEGRPILIGGQWERHVLTRSTMSQGHFDKGQAHFDKKYNGAGTF